MSPRKFAHLVRALGQVPNLTHLVVTKRLFRSAVPDVTGQVGTEATEQQLIQDGAPYRPGRTVGLSGLQQTYQATLAGTPTTEVVVQDAKGNPVKVLRRWQGQDGTPVKTTIDLQVQRAAQRALSGVGFSGAVVAIQAGAAGFSPWPSARPTGFLTSTRLAGNTSRARLSRWCRLRRCCPTECSTRTLRACRAPSWAWSTCRSTGRPAAIQLRLRARLLHGIRQPLVVAERHRTADRCPAIRHRRAVGGCRSTGRVHRQHREAWHCGPDDG